MICVSGIEHRPVDRLLQIGDLALGLFAGIRHERDVGSERDQHVRTQVRESFHGGFHIVGTHHRSAELASHKSLGRRRLVTLQGIGDAVSLADIALARHGAHGGIPQTRELVEVPHELHGLRRSLAEARTGIDADALRRYACRLEHGRLARKVIANLGHHVVIDRVVLHGGRLALHVHDHAAGIARGGNLHHGGIAETRHVVDDRRAGFDARAGHFGVARVDAHADAIGGKRAHDVDGTCEFLFDRHGSGARDGWIRRPRR